MLSRCHDPANKNYPNYGGRGIVVHHSLLCADAFARFIVSLPGWDNESLSMDRINNNGDYEPGNIRMATRKTQANNRRRSRA